MFKLVDFFDVEVFDPNGADVNSLYWYAMDNPPYGCQITKNHTGEIFTYEGATIIDTREVIALSEAGEIRCDVDLFAFDEVEEAFAKLVSGELRIRAVIRIAQ